MQAAMETAGIAPNAFEDVERIFREHHERVFRAAYRVTGNAMDAEDVLQTVFLRILRREDGPPLSETPGSYLHRAAVNAALDLARRRRVIHAAPLEEVGSVPDGRPAPDSAGEAREARERLRAALATLHPRAAEIFSLRYFEGYSNREIARMLGTSWSTVAVTLHRTRARLRKEIGGGRP